MRILLALVILCQFRDLLAQGLTIVTTVTTQRSNTVKENLNIAEKRLEFVNIIRDDLQRNNDDYALLERPNQLAHPAPASQPPYRKRMLPLGPRPQPLRLYYGDTRRGENVKNQSFQDDNPLKSYTHSNHYKILRVNKLKRLLNKDKVRMREAELTEENTMINTQPETRSPSSLPAPPPPQPPPQSAPLPTTARSPAPPAREPRLRVNPQDRGAPPPEDMEQKVPVLRQRKDKSHSPSPDQLDMAAARNPELTRIRLKGRLCQRSMMNLEGPTYDKLGKEVVPEYKPRRVRGRQFHQTRAPGLLLPRCCNCCKKSVLGCQ